MSNKKKNSSTKPIAPCCRSNRLEAHLLLGLDPLVDGGDGGAGAVLEGEDSLLDESDGSHFDDGWGFDGWSVLGKVTRGVKVLGFVSVV